MQRALHCASSHLRPTALGLFILAWAAGFWVEGWPVAAAVFALSGIVALGARRLCRVDLDRGIAVAHWGLFGISLWRRASTDAASTRGVRLRREIRFANRARKSGSYEVFVVELQADPPLLLRERRDFGRARGFAEWAARALDLPLLDSSTGRLRRRAPGVLDLTLGQRLRQAGKEPAYPAPPAGSRMRFRDRGRTKEVTLPAQPLPTLGYVIGLGIPVLGIVLAILGGGEFPQIWVAVPFLVLFALLILATRLPRSVRFGPDDIRVRWFHLRNRMRFDELEEVVTVRLDVFLLSDRKRIGLPYDFADKEEARFMVALIEYLAWQHPSSTAVPLR